MTDNTCKICDLYNIFKHIGLSITPKLNVYAFSNYGCTICQNLIWNEYSSKMQLIYHVLSVFDNTTIIEKYIAENLATMPTNEFYNIIAYCVANFKYHNIRYFVVNNYISYLPVSLLPMLIEKNDKLLISTIMMSHYNDSISVNTVIALSNYDILIATPNYVAEYVKTLLNRSQRHTILYQCISYNIHRLIDIFYKGTIKEHILEHCISTNNAHGLEYILSKTYKPYKMMTDRAINKYLNKAHINRDIANVLVKYGYNNIANPIINELALSKWIACYDIFANIYNKDIYTLIIQFMTKINIDKYI